MRLIWKFGEFEIQKRTEIDPREQLLSRLLCMIEGSCQCEKDRKVLRKIMSYFKVMSYFSLLVKA